MKLESLSSRLFRYGSGALAGMTWLSSGLFGLYILVFYAGGIASGSAARWNTVLPGLYAPSRPLSTTGMALHFAAGGMILALGFIQLIEGLRKQVPALHRWLGRVYVASGAIAGFGGLTFIAVKGTIGGWPMNLGFGIYGVLMLVAAAQTYRYARQGRLDQHRAWAIRLFALAIGSWLYRMEYGFWFLLTHRLGHSQDFHGAFDVVMAFFFYVPNLLVAEAYLRGRTEQASPMARMTMACVMVMATCLLALATYFFAVQFWWPAIAGTVA